MARSGLFVDPVPGNPPVGTAMSDARRVLGAVGGTVFKPISGGTVSTSGSNMNVTVAQSVWNIPDPLDSASAFWSATDAATLTPASGPATGSRIDLIVVKQNNIAGGDADSRVNISLVAGTPAASPTAPSTPAGAQVIAQVLVPTNASTSNACTITYMGRQAVQAPREIAVTTRAILLGITGEAAGQLASVTADATAQNNGLYQWISGAWRQLSNDTGWVLASTGIAASSGFSLTGAKYRILNGVAYVGAVGTRTGATLTPSSTGALATAAAFVTLPSFLTPAVSNGIVNNIGASASGPAAGYASSAGTLLFNVTAPGESIASGWGFDISAIYSL